MVHVTVSVAQAKEALFTLWTAEGSLAVVESSSAWVSSTSFSLWIHYRHVKVLHLSYVDILYQRSNQQSCFQPIGGMVFCYYATAVEYETMFEGARSITIYLL